MNIVRKAEQLVIVRVIRSGLVNMIPVLLIGAFALVLKTFPVEGYQSFMNGLADGFFIGFFDMIINATFGVMSVYMTLFISNAYMNLRAEHEVPLTGSAASSILCFFILAGAGSQGFGMDSLGSKSMFLAILTGLGATSYYLKLYKKLSAGRINSILSKGADKDFNRMLSTVAPILIVAVTFALFNALAARIFDVSSFRELFIRMLNRIFRGNGIGFFKGFFFVMLSSVLWFLGIHGSDTLEGVMQEYFVPGLVKNQEAVAAGLEPTHILPKQFFDCFVLMGGCGATICLLLAILIFSRNKSRRRLGTAAAFPMLFNINELMVFGLPIIYNPVMLIPFLITPLACYTSAFIATSAGLVPVITGDIEWTTPVILGGYFATGSVAGSLLQVFNIIMGVLIYAPFVRMLDRQTEEEAKRVFEDFVRYFKENEIELADRSLIYQQDIYGEFARNLTAELKNNIRKSFSMHYQPQYNHDGKCVGAESLLRWINPVYGFMYPPLLIKLAQDGGFLPELEEEIMLRVLDEEEKVKEKYGENIKISVNITGVTVVTDRFLQFCRQLNEKKHFAEKNVCIEVTEQATLAFNDKTVEALKELREMGLKLAIDDFSMGRTSINYMKNNLFDIIKLDGSLVKGLLSEDNSLEIVTSILQLADSLHMMVIAEFVETEKQRDILHDLGCDCYQGWLYSPAKPL